MTHAVPGELRLTRARWRIVGGSLRTVIAVALVLGYALLLGARGLRLWLLAVLLLAVTAAPIVVSLLLLITQLTGPAAGVTRDGVRLRVRTWRRRVVTIPWDEITVLWIGHAGAHRYLCLAADPRGAHADEWDPGGRRFTSRFRPLSVYLPGSVPTERVTAAVADLSAGAVTVADRGPDGQPFADRKARTGSVWLGRIVLLASLVAGLPALLDLATPWNQPWWPGVTAANALPDPCEVVVGQHAVALGVTDRRTVENDMLLRSCEYTVPQGQLTVMLELHHAYFGSSADDAHNSFESVSLGAVSTPVRDVGDEARMVSNPPGTTTMIDRSVARLAARRANVVLFILYGGEKDPDAAQAAVIGAARATLDALPVR
jgi:hypothetical protein